MGNIFILVLVFLFLTVLSRITNMRRARNNVRIAYEKQTETLRQLQKDVEQAVLDREGYAKETIQMEKKVKADALAYQITLRKFVGRTDESTRCADKCDDFVELKG